MSRIFLWGAGRCGRCLGLALEHAGHQIVGSWNRTEAAAKSFAPVPWPIHWGASIPETLEEADVVWVTVVDQAIAQEAARIGRPHHIMLHASGALPARVLRGSQTPPRSVASCHPLQSFTPVTLATDPIGQVQRSTFGIEGEPEAVQVAQGLVADMRANTFVVKDETDKQLYHAACCVASNAMVALADLAVELFAASGVSREDGLRALAPLIQGTADNLSQAADPKDVLTGPVHRGDTAVIKEHLNAIKARCPELVSAYEQTVRDTLKLVPQSPAKNALKPNEQQAD